MARPTAGSLPLPHREGEVADEDDGAAEQLASRAGQGDATACSELVSRFEARVFRFVLRFCANAHDAEDIVQDTFVKAWRALPRYRSRSRTSFRSWLFTIARRTALNHLRACRPTEPWEDHHERFAQETLPEPASSTDADSADLVWKLATRLKPVQQEALRLCYLEGFTVVEAAEILGMSAVRLRVLLHRVRRKLAHWLPAEMKTR